MRYIKIVLKKNILIVLTYIGLGIFNAFMSNYKADYFQQIIDGLSAGKLTFTNIMIYGSILISIHCMSYFDNYPDQKLAQGIYLDFKLLALKKISTIDYMAYQKIGTGKLVQRIENGASAGRNVIYNFWLRVIRDLLPTIVFSIYFIWKINKAITYALLIGYVIIFIM